MSMEYISNTFYVTLAFADSYSGLEMIESLFSMPAFSVQRFWFTLTNTLIVITNIWVSELWESFQWSAKMDRFGREHC